MKDPERRTDAYPVLTPHSATRRGGDVRVHIVTEIDVHRPIERVFAFVTTPGNWARWHPSSRGVRGEIDRPAGPGDAIFEDYLVAGRSGTVKWVVAVCEPPTRWVIDGHTDQGWRGSISYTLTAHSDQITHFTRELAYDPPGPIWTLVDRFVMRRRVRAESDQAVAQLKQVLEAGG